MHLPPRIVIGRNAAYGCRCALEAPASGPEFAIERRRRPTRREPRGRAYWRAATRPQAMAVPVATHAVELLADPVRGQVDRIAVVVAVRWHHGRRFGPLRTLGRARCR